MVFSEQFYTQDKLMFKNESKGNSLAVQWLGLCALTAQGVGSIPGWGTKILQTAWCGKRERE